MCLMLCNLQSPQAPVSSLLCTEVTSPCALQLEALDYGAVLIHTCTNLFLGHNSLSLIARIHLELVDF